MTSLKRRRSDRSGRAPLLSPDRPPVAGRDELRRFWAAIALGLSSEDAAAGANVPQAVGARWFRKAGGMPPAMFGTSARPLSGRYLSFAEREEIALSRAQGCTVQEVARQIGRAASTISRELQAQRRHPQRRFGVSRVDCTMARRAISPTTKADKACAERDLAGLCPGPAGGAGRSSEWRFCSWPVRILERATTRTAAVSPMGACLKSEQIARRLPVDFPDGTSPCASAMRLSTKPCSSTVEARCVAN